MKRTHPRYWRYSGNKSWVSSTPTNTWSTSHDCPRRHIGASLPVSLPDYVLLVIWMTTSPFLSLIVQTPWHCHSTYLCQALYKVPGYRNAKTQLLPWKREKSSISGLQDGHLKRWHLNQALSCLLPAVRGPEMCSYILHMVVIIAFYTCIQSFSPSNNTVK